MSGLAIIILSIAGFTILIHILTITVETILNLIDGDHHER